jgi:hypothetical protein
VAVTAAQVRLRGGINDTTTSYRLWDLANDAALTTMISDLITQAVSYHTYRIGADYTQTADAGLVTVMDLITTYWVLAEAWEALKARKVVGTHFAVDSEEAAAYQQLIDVEWRGRYNELAADFIVTETTDPYSLGVFVVSTALDRTSSDVTSICDQNAEILAEANCWCVPA